MGLIRLGLVLLIGLPILYLLLRTYARSLERERLEDRWDAGMGEGERDAYIEAGMARYERSLRARLVWGVVVLPLVAIAIVIYVLNFD